MGTNIIRQIVIPSRAVGAWRGAKEAVGLWAILQSRKRPGVLTRAVRGTGIPSAVRVRFLTETSNAKCSRANL